MRQPICNKTTKLFLTTICTLSQNASIVHIKFYEYGFGIGELLMARLLSVIVKHFMTTVDTNEDIFMTNLITFWRGANFLFPSLHF